MGDFLTTMIIVLVVVGSLLSIMSTLFIVLENRKLSKKILEIIKKDE